MPDRVETALATIIVLFHPHKSIVPFVRSLHVAHVRVVLVVNAIEPTVLEELMALAPFGVIRNTANRGLANAFNQGLQYAFARGMTHALLLDQDSRPSPQMGAALLDLFLQKKAAGVCLACIGPNVIDRKRPQARSLPLHARSKSLVEMRTIISSGSLLSRSAFEAIGPMWSELFIDGVDHEWCFRAKREGYTVGASSTITMEHDMGDAGISFFGRYKPIQRNPFRHYHLVRNTLWLAHLNYIPRAWRMLETAKLAYRVPIYLLTSTNRGESFRAMWRGLRDGFRVPNLEVLG